MANIGSFDATQVKPQESFDPIPAGKYKAMVTESDVVQTKAGTGHLLKLTWEVLEGDYQGRKIFDNINLDNPNPQAVEIGQRTLSAICHAVGKLHINDSSELHDVPCIIKVAIRPATGQYDAQNTIKSYESTSGVAAKVPQAAAAPAQQTTTKKAPWAA